MPTEIQREGVRALVANGGQLVEVLSPANYEKKHLAGAINIPLTILDRESTAQLRQDRPVIVYCNDFQ